VRLKAGLIDADYNGNISITSTNADTKTVACSGIVGAGSTPTSYNISISAGSNGIVKENNVTLTNGSSLSVGSGATKTFTFTPNTGYEVGTLLYNNVDVKSQISNNQYSTPVVSANATLSVTFQKAVYQLSIKSAESGTSDLLCDYGATPSFKFTPSINWKVNTVFYNSIDVTSSLVNGVYTVPAIIANGLLNVSFVSIATGAPQLVNGKIKVYTNQSDIVVEGITAGETVHVYTESGVQLQTLKSKGERLIIPVKVNAIYLVKTATNTFKVIN
jgi:hypothetical protein